MYDVSKILTVRIKICIIAPACGGGHGGQVIEEGASVCTCAGKTTGGSRHRIKGS